MVISIAGAALAATHPYTRDYVLDALLEHCGLALQCTTAWMARGLLDASPPELPPSPCRGCPFGRGGHPDAHAKTPDMETRHASPRDTLEHKIYTAGLAIISKQPLTQPNIARKMGTSRSNLQRLLKPFPGLWDATKRRILDDYMGKLP